MKKNYDEEIWKVIDEFPDYEVSNYGNVRRKFRRLEGYKYLKPQLTERGYLAVILYNNKTKKRKRFRVHRLVAKAFIPNTDNKPQVNHKDMNKKNNHVENLEWCTNQENCIHYHLHKNDK